MTADTEPRPIAPPAAHTHTHSSPYVLAPSLSTDLFRELRPDFFRVLSGPNASVYVDLLDTLERECAQRNEGIPRDEALGILSEVLSRHPDFQPDAETSTPDLSHRDSLPVREKARAALDYLARCGWLEAETAADWRREIVFDAHGSSVLATLRRIAHPETAVFTDKLVGVCAALGNESEMACQPWEHLQTCRDNTRQGIVELRAMQKGVERLIRRQVESKTMGQNLSLVFDHYAEQIGHACYAELVRSQLPARLSTAREHLLHLIDDQPTLDRMQAEVLRRNPSMSPATAMSVVRNQIDQLSQSLDRVVPLADSIDNRTAEFTRRSLARFRYLQEVVGERRAQVQSVFESINATFAQRKFSDLDEAPALPDLFLPESRLLAGRDSLYEPPHPRVVEDNAPIDDAINETLRDRTRMQMESALRDSLTVSRANALITRLPGGKGARISSADFPLRNEDDIADVMALLLHAESAEARYRVETPRVIDEFTPATFDPRAACHIERFFIIKK